MSSFLALLFFLPAFASWRPLDVYEADACRCIYGTSDVEKLAEIERDPVRFWREQKEALAAPGATITHPEFCQKFVEEAKEYIAQYGKDSKGKIFFRDGEGIDEVLQSVIAEDHPAWPTAQAVFYGRACDCLQDLHKIDDTPRFDPYRFDPDRFDPDRFHPYRLHPDRFHPYRLHPDRFHPYRLHPDRFDPYRLHPNRFDPDTFDPDTFHPDKRTRLYDKECSRIAKRDQKVTQKDVKRFLALGGCLLTEEFNKKQVWLAQPCAGFPIVSSLIMHSEGKYLSSAVRPEKRYLSGAHPTNVKGVYEFSGWGGVIEHDGLSHALRQYEREGYLERRYALSATEHFNAYCNPDSIVQGNIIQQSQQHLGWFYNSHELPSIKSSYKTCLLEEVLFPYSSQLTDKGFKNIAAFFVLPSENWKSCGFHCDEDVRYFDSNCHKTLMKWRNTYCAPGWSIVTPSYFAQGGVDSLSARIMRSNGRFPPLKECSNVRDMV